MKTNIPPLPSIKRGALSSSNPTSVSHVESTSDDVSSGPSNAQKENDIPAESTQISSAIAPGGSRIASIPPLKRNNIKISSNSSSPVVQPAIIDAVKRSRVHEASPLQSRRILLLGSNASANTPSVTSSPSATLTSPPVLNSNTSNGRVLRFGETIESFFCLPSDFSVQLDMKRGDQYTRVDWYDHFELCKDIVQDIDGAANDLGKWKQVLDIACHYVAQQQQQHLGESLIRLLRRATSRFRSMENPTGSQALLDIWLFYARATSLYSSREEAKSIFVHMQHKQLGIKNASFYLAYADFELDGCKCELENQKDCPCIIRAKTILELGLQHQAHPSDEILSFRKNIPIRNKTITFAQSSTIINQSKENRIMQQSSTAVLLKSEKVMQTSIIPTEMTPIPTHSTLVDQITAPPATEQKNQVSLLEHDETLPMNRMDDTHKTNAQADDNDTLDLVISFKTPSSTTHPYNTVTSTGEPRNESYISFAPSVGDTAGHSTSSKSNIHQRLLLDKPLSSYKHVHDYDKENSIHGRSLTVPRSQLGPALRVHSSNDPTNQDEPKDIQMENDLDRTGSGEMNHSIIERDDMAPDNGSAPKITRADIGYMLNWIPSGPRPNSAPVPVTKLTGKEDSMPDRPFKSTVASFQPSLEKIDEKYHPLEAESKHISIIPDHGKRSSTQFSEKNLVTEVHPTNPSLLPAVQPTKLPANSTPENMEVKLSSSPNIQDQAHPLFLPLVCENNIMRVNQNPYVKLSVIGKGGSCKVYRGLSKDKAIVAIKKVNLSGMSKKAIEGYANEIALLRKLQGTPSIIQLYDSEVDVKRKAIYLVMELGEIDLNHVLQQQQSQNEKMDDKEMNHTSLNMNFIRLTWQQMLSAVHSIHQERIIHGDLKPANFLFVKGALKLIDFGIAKAIQSDDTTNIYRDSQIGTLNYMSPESILDTGTGTNGGVRMRCGKPSDVWSLGCILYQMCYGKTPFADLNMFQKLQAIVSPSHTISFPNTTDEAAIDAMKRCLRRQPEERASITGENGLLTDHWFLHSKKK